jgi:hypothetical protein
MRLATIVMSMLLGLATSASAQLSITFGLPGVSIGINVPVYPQLDRVPGYPVYYAPGLRTNFFFYDGMYWVYEGDEWYASTWYNGPWGRVSPEAVPLFVLRVPVRYYRSPPAYFRGWRPDAPPHWGEHWGPDWQQHRDGWDRWDHRAAPAPAPRPVYQRSYSAGRYPQAEQQQALRSQNYRYQPREDVVRPHFQEQVPQPPRAPLQGAPQRAAPPPTSPAPPRGAVAPRPAPQQASPSPRTPAPQTQPPPTKVAPHQPPQPAARGGQAEGPQGKVQARDPQDQRAQGKPDARKPARGTKDRDSDDDHGPGHK